MREVGSALLYLVMSFCFIETTQALECKKVESFVQQVHTVRGKVVRERIKVDIEPEWSIHGGYYPNIFIADVATSGTLIFKKNGKTEKTIFKFENVSGGSLSKNLNLKTLIEEWVHRSPASVELEIKNKNKILCRKKYPIVVGE